MSIQIIHGDCVQEMAGMPDASIGAVVTDPPYGLEFMGKEWDRLQGYTVDIGMKRLVLPRQRRRNVKCHECGLWFYTQPPKNCTCGGVRRLQQSSMQAWHENWLREAYRVLVPGATLQAFGGTRTFHRLCAAMEAAGFVVLGLRGWAFGSGFPKSMSLSKAMDRAVGAEREVIGVNPNTRKCHAEQNTWRTFEGRKPSPMSSPMLTAPATDDAKRWSGWGTALKPAWEPILVAWKPNGEPAPAVRPGIRVVTVARKPLAGTVAANCLKWGCGGINIDACRVRYQDMVDQDSARPQGRCTTKGGGVIGATPDAGRNLSRVEYRDRPRPTRAPGWDSINAANAAAGYRPDDYAQGGAAYVPSPGGRWPANLVLCHRPGCRRSGTQEVRTSTHFPTRRGGTTKIGCVGHHGQECLVEARPGREPAERWQCVEGCPVAALDAQAGERKSGMMVAGQLRRESRGKGGYHDHFPDHATRHGPYGDAGLVSRFFQQIQSDGMEYPVELLAELVRLIAPPGGLVLVGGGDDPCWSAEPDNIRHGAVVCGTPDTNQVRHMLRCLRPGAHLLCVAPVGQPTGHVGACRLEDGGFEIRDSLAVLEHLDALYYCAKASRSERTCDGRVENKHPTVKPVAVMRWLLRQTSTETVVLDPFLGSGTTALGAIREGHDMIGIEKSCEYIDIANGRMAACRS